MKICIIVFSVVIIGCFAQRPSFAGRRPIGFPYIPPSTAAPGALESRFGDIGEATTIILPLEAQGDAELVARLSKLPIDNQPFWLINWKALEANRRNPQTYAQRANSFIDNNSNILQR